MSGPTRDTTTVWLRGLRNRLVATGTGLAHPYAPIPDTESRAGTSSVPTGSTCFAGLRVRRPARLAVSSPKASATTPWEISWRMMEGTRTQK